MSVVENENTLNRNGEAEATPIAHTPSVVRKRRSKKRDISIFTVATVLSVALLVLLWTQLTTPAFQTSNKGALVGDITSPLIGKAAPNLVLIKPNGAPGSTLNVAISQYKGRPVILNFWSAYCDPCNSEAPFLKTAVPKLQGQGVQYVSVNAAAESPGVIDAFNQKYGLTFPGVQDTVNGDTAIAYGVATIPVTVFIDRNGIIRGMISGELTQAGLNYEMSKIKS